MRIDGIDFTWHSTDSIPALHIYLRLIYSKYKTSVTFVQSFVTSEHQFKILFNFRTDQFHFAESSKQSKSSVILRMNLLVLNSVALVWGKRLFDCISMDLRSEID